jgi:hypothetical protein
MQAVANPDEEKQRAERLRAEYINYGFQYYMLGRCAVAAWAHPVAGNQFHHAIEMLLKGGLCAHTTEDERINMRHRLPRIWKAFKKHYDPSNQLARFDALVRNLHKYESIRYPERIVQRGEVDAMVKAICVACRINPKFFTNDFQPPGSTCLRRDNAEDLF